MVPVTSPFPGLTLVSRTVGSFVIAELTGELDIANSPALRDQLLGLLGRSSSRLVLDLSKVTYCDASGLAVLVGTGRRARLLGGSLRLAAISSQVDEVLQTTGLLRSLDVFPTVRAAAASANITEPGGPGTTSGSSGMPGSRARPG
jgi:anti-anti-sigma factor